MIRKVKTASGLTRWIVRYYENGRDGARPQKTFDTRRDAEIYEASMRRALQLGDLACEVDRANQTVQEFIEEWWEKYATASLAPGTLASFAYVLDKWLVPPLGRMRLRDLSRETIDSFRSYLVAAGAGAPTVNRALGILQGILRRAVEWGRIPANPVVGARRIAHQRDDAIDARTPETVELIRKGLDLANATLVSVLAYEGLRPAEAFALEWSDVMNQCDQPRLRLRIQRALSDGRVSTTKSRRSREPELFPPVARDLSELYLATGKPDPDALVFPDAKGRHLRRQNWRQRTWVPALKLAEVGYFRPYDLRHTCATLLIYEGRTVNEVAQHLGHRDPGFSARTYQHIYSDAAHRRVPINDAILAARRRTVDVRTAAY